MMARLCTARPMRARVWCSTGWPPSIRFPPAHEDCVGAYWQLLELGIAADRIVRERHLRRRRHGARRAAGIARPRAADAGRRSPDVATDRPHGSARRLARHQRRARSGAESASAASRCGRCTWVESSRTWPTRTCPPCSVISPACPPLFFQVGSTEILLDDSRRCAERARAAGVATEVEVWNEMPHGWQGLPVGAESQRAIEHCADFVRECCP